ncbi:MAG TPA: hypothetical protein PKE04_12790, partial [Clostridia bacterium]|nr:hypothetical protein [Clostridia bacterium]
MIKRIIPALLLTAMLLTLTPAATLAEAGTSQLSEPGVFPLVKEKAELSVLCSDAAYLSDFNENKFTAWYEEQTNVHVTYIHVPSTSK